MIWALFEHLTRRLIYYEHDSQILTAKRYSMTECYNRGSSVSIIKNKRTHVLSRLKACNSLIFRRKERSRLRLDRPFSEILGNYRLLTFTYSPISTSFFQTDNLITLYLQLLYQCIKKSSIYCNISNNPPPPNSCRNTRKTVKIYDFPQCAN